jgi:protein gp37
MSENSSISWTDHTFNPWVGCTKVSPACDHCYAERWAKRAGKAAGVVWGGERRRTSEANWRKPLKWNAQAEREGRRYRVFCASLADVFDNQVPAEWRQELLELIRSTPHLDWLLLTKRIGNAQAMIDAALSNMDIGYSIPFAAWPWPNVWLGATICNQEEADRDIPKLLDTAARVRFISVEPMLGDIRLGSFLQRSPSAAFEAGKVTRDMPAWTRIGSTAIDWVICGGESGPHARPMHPDWARSLRDQCKAAGVPFHFKQHGEWIGVPDLRLLRGGQGPGFGAYDRCAYDYDHEAVRVGAKHSGRLLDGVLHDAFPVPSGQPSAPALSL